MLFDQLNLPCPHSLQMMAAAVVDDLVQSQHQEGSPETRRLLAAAEGLQQAEEHAEAHLRAAAGTAAVVCQSDQEEAAAQEAGAGGAADALVPSHSWLHMEPAGRGQQGRDSAGGAAGSRLLCNSVALQLWLLRCCQSDRGGFKDKPGKPPDYYHTCYCLSGLSAMQHMGGRVLGPQSNLLVRADPLCNVVKAHLDAALVYNSRTARA